MTDKAKAVGFSADDSDSPPISRSSTPSGDDADVLDSPISKDEKKMRRRSMSNKKSKDQLIKAKTLRLSDLESFRKGTVKGPSSEIPPPLTLDESMTESTSSNSSKASDTAALPKP